MFVHFQLGIHKCIILQQKHMKHDGAVFYWSSFYNIYNK